MHLVDDGSPFDVSLDLLWKYIQSESDHRDAHKGRRNFHQKSLGENSFLNTWEQEVQGSTVQIENRVTALPPIGFAVEFLQGPMAGSKFFNYYTPQGNQTKVTVVGEFQSTVIPPHEIEPTARGLLEEVYQEDLAGLRHFQAKR